MTKDMGHIQATLGYPELLCQLAEECQELGKAALKLRRAMTGTNPTPVTQAEAWKNLTEEVADVTGVLKVLEVPVDSPVMQVVQDLKMSRWVHRLKEKEEQL